MKEGSKNRVKSSIISLIVGIVLGFLVTYWFSGNLYYNLIAVLTLLFISQAPPEVFKQGNNAKRWVYSTIAALSFVPICLNASLWLLFTLLVPFLLVYFGGLSALRAKYRKVREAAKCQECGAYSHQYNHKPYHKFFDNTYANPVYRTIIESKRK